MRREAILDAAAELLAERDYSEISFNEIARRARFTKSNVYRYFSSREEIYLQLYLDEVTKWSAELAQELKKLPANAATGQLSKVLANALLARPRLLDLMPLLSTSLERNSAADAVLRFKFRLAEVMRRLTAALGRVLPGVPEQRLVLLLTAMHALVAGLWPMANPNKIVQQVMEQPELVPMNVNFASTAKGTFSALIDGLKLQPPRISMIISKEI